MSALVKRIRQAIKKPKERQLSGFSKHHQIRQGINDMTRLPKIEAKVIEHRVNALARVIADEHAYLTKTIEPVVKALDGIQAGLYADTYWYAVGGA